MSSGNSSALGWVRVLTTIDSPSLSRSLEIGPRTDHVTDVRRGCAVGASVPHVHDVARADRGPDAVGLHQRAVRSGPRRWPSRSSTSPDGQVDADLPADGDAGGDVRLGEPHAGQVAAAPPTRRRPPSSVCSSATSRSVRSGAAPRLEPRASEVASGTGSSSAVMPTLSPMPTTAAGPLGGLDPLDQDAGDLAVAERARRWATSRAASNPAAAERLRHGVPGQQRQPRPRPGRRGRPQQHRERERRARRGLPASGPAGRGPRSGARRRRPGPRPAPSAAAVGDQRVGGAGLVDHLHGEPREQVRTGRGQPAGVEGWACRSGSRSRATSLPRVSAQARRRHRGPRGPTSTSTPPPASWPTSTDDSTRRCTPARRRRSRSSTPRAARRPASGSRCSSTRAPSSSSTSWPGTGPRPSAWRRTGPTATA